MQFWEKKVIWGSYVSLYLVYKRNMGYQVHVIGHRNTIIININFELIHSLDLNRDNCDVTAGEIWYPYKKDTNTWPHIHSVTHTNTPTHPVMVFMSSPVVKGRETQAWPDSLSSRSGCVWTQWLTWTPPSVDHLGRSRLEDTG